MKRELAPRTRQCFGIGEFASARQDERPDGSPVGLRFDVVVGRRGFGSLAQGHCFLVAPLLQNRSRERGRHGREEVGFPEPLQHFAVRTQLALRRSRIAGEHFHVGDVE